MRMVSNETRDKLKKMGLTKKTMFVWCTVLDETWIEPRKNVPNIHDDGLMVEPVTDLSFLVEALPASLPFKKYGDDRYTLSMDKSVDGLYHFYYVDFGSGFVLEQSEWDTNPAEATAQLLIHIVEQGYAEIKNGKVVAV